MENEERDTELKVPFSSFVAEEVHACVDAEAATSGGEEEHEAFGGAVGITATAGELLVSTHDKECSEVNKGENAYRDEFGFHKAI